MSSSRQQKFADKRRLRAALGDKAPKFSFRLGPQASHDCEFAVSLPFARSRVAIWVVGCFFAAFAFPLFGVTSTLIDTPDGSLFSLVSFLFTLLWALGWSVAVIGLGLVFCALLFGGETLVVERQLLSLRMGLPGISFGASYPAEFLRNFRRESPNEKEGSGWRGEHLAFDYAGEAVGFGSNIDEEKAESILQELNRLFPAAMDPLPPLPELPAQDPLLANAQKSTQQARPMAGPSPDRAKPNTLGSPSSIALIVANCIPLGGVVFLGWDIGEIMLLFWAESGVIGFYNLLKLVRVAGWGAALYGPFFLGHYGGFMVGHLLFIYGFFGENLGEVVDVSVDQLLADLWILSPALAAFFISHGISFMTNFIGRREYIGKDATAQMGEPYKRIIVMHLTIIFGGFLSMMFSSALPALLLLIFLKVSTDLRGHLREHRPATGL